MDSLNYLYKRSGTGVNGNAPGRSGSVKWTGFQGSHLPSFAFQAQQLGGSSCRLSCSSSFLALPLSLEHFHSVSEALLHLIPPACLPCCQSGSADAHARRRCKWLREALLMHHQNNHQDLHACTASSTPLWRDLHSFLSCSKHVPEYRCLPSRCRNVVLGKQWHSTTAQDARVMQRLAILPS